MIRLHNIEIEKRNQYTTKASFFGKRLKVGKQVGWTASCHLFNLYTGHHYGSFSDHYDLDLAENQVREVFLKDVHQYISTLYSELTRLVLASLTEEGRWVVEAPPHTFSGSSYNLKLLLRDTKTDTLWIVIKEPSRYPRPTTYRLDSPVGIPVHEKAMVAQSLYRWFEMQEESAAAAAQQKEYEQLMKLYKQEGKDEA